MGSCPPTLPIPRIDQPRIAEWGETAVGKKFVPVTLGSPRFRTAEVGGLRVTDAWFPPGVHVPPHHHDRACFAVVVEGSFDVRFARGTHDCPSATVWTEPAGERHANRAEDGGARVVVVQPDHTRAELLRPLDPLLSGIHHFSSTGIAGLARRTMHELRHSDGVAELSLESLALEMLVSAFRQRPQARATSRRPVWLSRAQEYLHAHFRDRIALSEIARQAGVHPVHLSRVFRSHFGASIGDYVRGLRLDWAAERLLRSADPLSDISLAAGFADQSHFTRAFKQHTGLTPGRYRAAKQSTAR